MLLRTGETRTTEELQLPREPRSTRGMLRPETDDQQRRHEKWEEFQFEK